MMLTTIVEINPEDMVNRLSWNEAKDLIKAIDQSQCDVDFTFEMAEWFIKDVLYYDVDEQYANKFKKLIEEAK